MKSSTRDAVLIVLLALLSMVGPLGIDTYLPSFPAIGASLSASPVAVQQTLSVYLLCMSVTTLFYGTLSDSLGRRRVMLVSVLLFALTSVAAAYADSIGALIFWRALQGLTVGAGSVVGRAVVQDHFKGHDAQRANAIMTMVFGLAPAIAPVLGGWLQTALGWRSVFAFLALFGAVLLVVCLRFLPETLAVEKRVPFAFKPIAQNYLRCVSHVQFVVMSLAIGFIFSGIAIYIGGAAAFVMGILHKSETDFAWLFLPLIGGMVSGSAVAGKLVGKVSSGRMIRWGFALMVIATVVNVAYTAAFVAQVPYAVMPMALYTFGLALAMPGLSVRTLDLFPAMSGMAASMQGFIQMLLFTLVSGLVAPLLFGSALYMAVGHAAGVLAGVGLWVAATRLRSL